MMRMPFFLSPRAPGSIHHLDPYGPQPSLGLIGKASTTLLISIFLSPIASQAESGQSGHTIQISADLHQKCLSAADYKGCVEVNTSGSLSNDPQCDNNGWCIAKAGQDRFGLPRRVGWKYKYVASSNTVKYIDPQIRKIRHKNRSDRYFTLNSIIHSYEQPVAATPGYYRTTTEGKTTCNITNNWTPPHYSGGKLVSGGYQKSKTRTCTTTEPKRVWVPGKPGKPGGPRVYNLNEVFDCTDKTIGYYWDGHLRGNWKKAGSVSTRKFIKQTCLTITNLPKSGLKI